jgi:hypothetical protein
VTKAYATYVGTTAPMVDDFEPLDMGCPRLRNGLWADDPSHCIHCFARIRAATAPRQYRIRDANGRVISDWLL